MADKEAIAATLTGAIIQARAIRIAGQAQLLKDPAHAAASPTEAADTVRLYLNVLKEVQSQSQAP